MVPTSPTDDPSGQADGPLLRIAVPNKGVLSQSATEMLRESGYRQRQDSKELTLVDADNGVEFYYLRPRDIALYVGEGTLDVGITGRDLLLDSGAKAEEVLELGFGRSRFRFAARPGTITSVEDLAGTARSASPDRSAGTPTCPSSRAPGSPRRTSGSCGSTSPSAGSTPP